MTAGITRALLLGPLEAAGHQIMRSGFRWLRAPGARCRPGEPIATCHLGLLPTGEHPGAHRTPGPFAPGPFAPGPFAPGPFAPGPFADERRDLRAVLVAPAAGILHPHPDLSRGGFIDRHPELFWQPDEAIGTLTSAAGTPDEPLPVALMMLAGRRMTELAEARGGLLASWHERRRAWWGEGTPATLLALGTCELAGVMQGDAGGFPDFFRAAAGPAQCVLVTDEPLAPCVRVLHEQMTRSPAEQQEITADAARGVLACGIPPTPADWLFMGALLAGLTRSPLTESYDILTRAGLRRGPPAAAVILSLAAEARDVLRHRRLGYTVSLYDFRLAECGPAIRAWLRAEFDPIARSPDDIRADYRQFLASLRAGTDPLVLVLNRIATDAQETIVSYAGLPTPLGTHLRSVRTRELNLMLHDLGHEFALEIVDAESIAAALGVIRHIPDYLHPGGRMQAELRAEILHILRQRGIPGFAARPDRSATDHPMTNAASSDAS